MFSSYIVDIWRKTHAIFLEENTGKENVRRIFVVPKSKIRILERMKKG